MRINLLKENLFAILYACVFANTSSYAQKVTFQILTLESCPVETN